VVQESDDIEKKSPSLAVIIAAGQGTRLRDSTGDDALIKPISPLMGVPIIVRVLRTMMKAGVRKAVVVTGYEGGKLESFLKDDKRLSGLELVFARNDDWQKSNGLSVLAAREAAGDDNFFLSMADHIYSIELIEALKQRQPVDGGLVLAVDRRVHDLSDPDDAMWVRIGGDKGILRISKDLTEYDCVDCGVFSCTPGLFDALESAKKENNGDCALKDGVQKLADRHKAFTADIGDAWWQDIDTFQDLKEAEKKLLRSLRKPIDGIVARNINRYISLPISGWLVKHTNATPNQMSILCVLISLVAAALVAFSKGSYFQVLAGAALMQFSSIFDGVDGELARLKYDFSPSGEWIDTIGDDISNYSYVAAITYMAYTSGNWQALLAPLGVVALVGYAVAIPLAYSYIIMYTDSGDVMAVDYDFNKGDKSFEDLRWWVRLLARLKYVTKRDFFIFIFFVFALFGVLVLALPFAAIGAVSVALAAFSQHIKKLKKLREEEERR